MHAIETVVYLISVNAALEKVDFSHWSDCHVVRERLDLRSGFRPDVDATNQRATLSRPEAVPLASEPEPGQLAAIAFRAISNKVH